MQMRMRGPAGRHASQRAVRRNFRARSRLSIVRARFHASAASTTRDHTPPTERRSGRRRVGRDPLPQRGREHRGVRDAARSHDSPSTASPARSSSPTTAPRTAAAELATRAGARVVHEPRRGYGSAYLAGFAAARGDYIVMADADLTYDFAEIPRFVERARRRRRHGDRRPDGQHPAGRDAVAAPLRRQPGPDRHRSTSSSAPASATPTAACARCRRDVLPRARPAHDRHGVRLRDGDPRRQGGPRHPPVPDRVPPARRRVEAVELPRRLAPPALPARPQPDLPVRRPGRGDGARSAR